MVKHILDEADAGLHRIYVPSIILVEMIYLAEKSRINTNLVSWLMALAGTPDGSYAIAALDSGTAEALISIPRAIVPDMLDRIIAATALQLDLPLISKDEMISKLKTISVIW